MIKPIVFALFTLSLVSCQKNSDMDIAPIAEKTATTTQSTPLAGTWTWTKTVMGGRNSQNIAPVTPQSAGFTRTLTIDSNGRLTLKEGSRTYQATYTIVTEGTRSYLVSDAIEGMIQLSDDQKTLVINNSYRDLHDMYFVK